jgi:hypothetical protein
MDIGNFLLFRELDESERLSLDSAWFIEVSLKGGSKTSQFSEFQDVL